MKSICLIAALCVALLSAIPCCWGDHCEDNIELSQKTGQTKKDKDCKGCSPFFSCGTCSGFIFQKALFSFKKPVVKTAKPVIVYHCDYTGSFSKSIWQPPKMS